MYDVCETRPPRLNSGTSMRSDGLNPKQVAKLMRQSKKVLAYFEQLAGRCHQKHMPIDDPLKVAADDMRAAARVYHERLIEMGRRHAIADPWESKYTGDGVGSDGVIE